jgi:hypothetical protein
VPAPLIAGAALAVATTLAGLWLARRSARRLVGACGVGAAALVLAAVSGCPWNSGGSSVTVRSEVDPLWLTPEGALSGQARLEIDRQKSAPVRLVIPREQLLALLEKAEAGSAAPQP